MTCRCLFFLATAASRKLKEHPLLFIIYESFLLPAIFNLHIVETTFLQDKIMLLVTYIHTIPLGYNSELFSSVRCVTRQYISSLQSFGSVFSDRLIKEKSWEGAKLSSRKSVKYSSTKW